MDASGTLATAAEIGRAEQHRHDCTRHRVYYGSHPAPLTQLAVVRLRVAHFWSFRSGQQIGVIKAVLGGVDLAH
jgi:hypothetical protein